jgi:hypothetical protein
MHLWKVPQQTGVERGLSGCITPNPLTWLRRGQEVPLWGSLLGNAHRTADSAGRIALPVVMPIGRYLTRSINFRGRRFTGVISPQQDFRAVPR